MLRPRPLFLVAAVIALLLGPQVATAGPIGWGYSADVTAADGGHWVTFGTEYRTTLDPATGAEVSTPFRMMVNVAGGAVGTGTGSGSVRVSSFDPGSIEPYPVDDPWSLTRPAVFTLQFDLTDAASGLTRSLTYRATGTSSGYFTSGTGVVSLAPEPGEDTFVLGGSRYTVRPVARASESGAYLDVDVTVAAAAPEPGTIALAGVGLAAVGLGARRRATRPVASGG